VAAPMVLLIANFEMLNSVLTWFFIVILLIWYGFGGSEALGSEMPLT
jgi:hypothetical protein